MAQQIEQHHLRTSDAEVAESALREAYGSGLRMGGIPEGATFSLSHTSVGMLAYDEVLLPADLRFTNEAHGPLVVISSTGGTVERNCGGHSGTYGGGDV
ncbi:hypothetical protein [Streptomyces indicus]|uniref:Uncharacterized protein n=1 Tax=Streptomyces indicus TaxID=417292 RepID=A0A1G9IZL9_9ACTN|nr:hypothetical protein [Streptomyces indicus]SDL30314.1 hypothetical protein SAMN05421806_12619 [Streptomyces indicus]